MACRIFAVLAAAMLSVPAVAPAQIRLWPGAMVEGKVVAQVNVTLSDTVTTYYPVVDLRLALIGPNADTVTVTTNESGTAIALLASGEYLVESLGGVGWKQRRYRWSLPVDVQPGMQTIELTPLNAAAPATARRPPPPVDTSGGPPAAPEPQRYAFAEVPWGISGDSVQRLMSARGYAFEGTTTTGSPRFRTSLLGVPSDVLVLLRDGRAARVVVALRTSQEQTENIYRDLKATLTAKYGPPTTSSEQAVPPGAAAERAEDDVLGVGRAIASTEWIAGDTTTESLVLSITEALNVVVAYESRAWRR
ncbi:MAG: hypothetical protein M3373_07050 [Gemmatimonadota bacterium]|nr:hypothetical protein [Gemmatimonadota bacterium]